ncbi:MAG: type Z 30S ribosomal protein S14 [Candidatus Dojkabacteria bacterium]
MSKKSKLVKYNKLKKKSKFQTKVRNRCPLCGRPRGYMREFDMCRICFRNNARDAVMPGIRKSSW